MKRCQDRCRAHLALALLFVVVFAVGCETVPSTSKEPLFKGYKPRSILVLPPLDNTFEVAASYAYLPTVTRPIAERGYYVFPVAVVARLMRENGLPDPVQMHQVTLAKLGEIFGADAVLYLTLSDWGARYRVVYSATKVTVTGRLIDIKTGTQLWRGEASAADSSDYGSGKLSEILVGAVIRQVVASSVSDNSTQVARQANRSLFDDEDTGFPPGPYHPEFTP